ncbi:allantoicase, partial [Salarias fasciatus]|uniref:allantoicase n=1 Tax=Salarias fasciatus TaxID=181472 RepID=UPI001176B69E
CPSQVVFATDEWFAPARNLLKSEPPQFLPSVFTEFGKWMDGWETRRKRVPGHDWCLVQLGVPGRVHGIDVDTSFFTGNHCPHVSIQGGCLEDTPTFTLDGDRTGMAASDSQMAAVATLGSGAWPQLVGVAPLQPGSHHFFKVEFSSRVTHLRVNMFPDGGIARLRVYGVGQRDWSSVSSNQLLDLLALTNGGVCLGFSDAHFGHPRNMIGPGRAANMADGWETARRLDRPRELKVDRSGILQVPGSEWAVFRLGHRGRVSRVEVDTTHFRGNSPDSCRVEACSLDVGDESWSSAEWDVLLPPQKLRPHHRHHYGEAELRLNRPISHVRVVMAPDGGISRLRLWGRIAAAPANQERPASKL